MSAKKITKKSTKQTSTSNNQWVSYLIGGAIIIGVIVLGYLLYTTLRGPEPDDPIAGVIEHEHQERDHVDFEIEATDLPPVGGIHNPEWQNCGIYDEPIPVEHAVHSMEHGAVWVTYQPELPTEEVEALRDNISGEDFVLLSPYPGLKSPVVLTAWEVQLELDSVDDERISEFVNYYRQGPTTPERGATCQDGEGTPIG